METTKRLKSTVFGVLAVFLAMLIAFTFGACNNDANKENTDNTNLTVEKVQRVLTALKTVVAPEEEESNEANTSPKLSTPIDDNRACLNADSLFREATAGSYAKADLDAIGYIFAIDNLDIRTIGQGFTCKCDRGEGVDPYWLVFASDSTNEEGNKGILKLEVLTFSFVGEGEEEFSFNFYSNYEVNYDLSGTKDSIVSFYRVGYYQSFGVILERFDSATNNGYQISDASDLGDTIASIVLNNIHNRGLVVKKRIPANLTNVPTFTMPSGV